MKKTMDAQGDHGFLQKVAVFVLTMAGYNLTRLRNLGQIRLQGQM